jgi:hypothetical protein
MEMKMPAATVLEKVDYQTDDFPLVLLNDFLERWFLHRLMPK